MVGTLLRRAASTAIVAAVATVAAPMATAAWADVTPLAAPTFAPADGDTVAATRPAISATYNTALDQAVTQLVVVDTDASNSPISCPPVFSTDSTSIGCTPTQDLIDGHHYETRVHAVNAAKSTDIRNDHADWTLDIPSITVASPGDGSTVAVAQTLTATYDETIDSHSTVKLVNGQGVTVPGGVSEVKSGAMGTCPTSNCILKFVASQSLPAGSYTATFDAYGVNSGVGGGENAAAYAHDVIHFIVDKTKPAAAPYGVAPDDDAITSNNVTKVPFSGWALPGYNVGVAVYDEDCDQNCAFGDAEGFGPQDGFGHTLVENCTDDQSHTVSSGGQDYRLCPFSLTVDDSAGCDTGLDESQCGNGDFAATVKNQWYAYSYTGAGQIPAGASPATDPAIVRDTTAPSAPDDSAHGYLTNDSPSAGDASVHVAASDLAGGLHNYVVKATDGYGHSTTWTDLPNGSGNLLDDFTVAPEDGLFDGPVTVGVAAADQWGNTSSFRSVTADPGKSFAKEVVQLAIIDPSGHTDSMTTSTGTRDLATLTSAADKANPPSAVTVHFNEPITTTVPDQTIAGVGTPSAHLCIIAPGGICVTPNGTGILTVPTDDPTALTWTAPSGFGSDLPNGTYQIAAFAPAANCPTRTQTNTSSYSCETSQGSDGDLTSWPVLATFTIDKLAPTITDLAVSPTTITPGTVKAVTISGSSDPDTRAVQLSITSSKGGAPLILNQDVTPPSDPNASSVSWTFFPVDLSQVRDGTMTVSAIAVDDAGNQTAAPGTQTTATLAAHVSTLTEKVSSSKVTYGKFVLLSGHLSDQAHKAISKAIVSVRERFGNGTFTKARQAKTDSKGNWQMLWAPTHNGTFYARYAGSTLTPLHDAAAAHTAKVLVRAAIAFTSPKNGATVGSPVMLKGHVSPNKKGSIVSIYRHTSAKNILVGRAKLDSHSNWLFSLRIPAGATVRLFAQIGKTTGNLGNRSSLLTLKR